MYQCKQTFLFHSLAHLNAMARLKQEEVLKQRISEATGTPIGDINAQNSRWLYNKTLIFSRLLFRMHVAGINCNPLDRELHEIASALGLQIDTTEEDCKQSSSTHTPQQHMYASMLKQAGVSLVKSVVNVGIGEEAGKEVRREPDELSTEEESEELRRAKADVKRLQSGVKYSRNASDGGDKARRALKEAEEKVEALMMGSTPHKGSFQAASGITLEEGASPPSSIASQAPLIVETAPSPSHHYSNSIAHYLASSIPCNSITRQNKEETFGEATRLPVLNMMRSLEKKGERCIKTEVGQLMLKVVQLQGRGLSSSSTMGGHVENVKWVNLTGSVKSLN